MVEIAMPQLGQPTQAAATDCVVIWEPLAAVQALVTSLGLTSAVTTKADGSIKVKGIDSCIFASQRGVNMATTGEEAYIKP